MPCEKFLALWNPLSIRGSRISERERERDSEPGTSESLRFCGMEVGSNLRSYYCVASFKIFSIPNFRMVLNLPPVL
jgi:hypothetical protein